jgi:murein DD-endopeptidase MepM/ murein hydrolase activator NlpD
MRPPLDRMRLRALYQSKPQALHPGHSLYGFVRSGGHRPHQGWDLAAPPGTPVYAITYARCVHAQYANHSNQYDHLGFYGRHVLLEFLNQTVPGGNELKIPWVNSQKFYAFYAHLQDVYVAKGQEVQPGTVIGRTGRSGNAATLPIDQAHLHFEIRTRPDSHAGLAAHVDPGLFFPQPLAENQSTVASVSKR